MYTLIVEARHLPSAQQQVHPKHPAQALDFAPSSSFDAHPLYPHPTTSAGASQQLAERKTK
jgi:hypothetical protein